MYRTLHAKVDMVRLYGIIMMTWWLKGQHVSLEEEKGAGTIG